MKSLKILDRTVGPGERAFIIAEIGVNHDGSVERAIELVHLAAAAGADAVKLQIFKADALMHYSSTLADYQRDRVDDAMDAGGIARRVDGGRRPAGLRTASSGPGQADRQSQQRPPASS